MINYLNLCKNAGYININKPIINVLKVYKNQKIAYMEMIGKTSQRHSIDNLMKHP